MAKSGDEDHFDNYRAQTEVKHQILADYLKAYSTILLTRYAKIVYLDGFAGKGTYQSSLSAEEAPGSPLRALEFIASNEKFAEHIVPVFIEYSDELFRHLISTVTEFCKGHPVIKDPILLHGTFTEQIDIVIKQFGGRMPPTFLFVDPCGIKGVSFEAIRKIMAFDACESFIFFNIDGIRRTLGLDELHPTLVDVFGSKSRAKNLWQSFRLEKTPRSKEDLILRTYRQALSDDMGLCYTIPFGIQHQARKITSHYLIHATKKAVGFSIMKDVMWKLGETDDGQGGLWFEQASRTGTSLLFPLEEYRIEDSILEELRKNGLVPVNRFFKDWVIDHSNLVSESAYKKALLNLEALERIVVFDKDGKTPKPARNRMRKGSPTLGEGYFVRLVANSET